MTTENKWLFEHASYVGGGVNPVIPTLTSLSVYDSRNVQTKHIERSVNESKNSQKPEAQGKGWNRNSGEVKLGDLANAMGQTIKQ